jgi:nucleic acid/nucleotide deaminase of polymorphic system toxin
MPSRPAWGIFYVTGKWGSWDCRIPTNSSDFPLPVPGGMLLRKRSRTGGGHLKSAEPGHTIRKQYGNKSVHVGIHCECLLALHFVNRSRQEPPPLQYLGVSKLSCLCYWTFLKILKEHRFSFHAKGTQSKAYFPWAWPLTKSTTASLKAAEITFSFREELEALYVKVVLHARRRAKSDSTPGECVKKDDEDREAKFSRLEKTSQLFPTKERNESKSPFPITYVVYHKFYTRWWVPFSVSLFCFLDKDPKEAPLKLAVLLLTSMTSPFALWTHMWIFYMGSFF